MYTQQNRGISCSRKKRKLESDYARDSPALDLEIDVCNQTTDEIFLEPIINRKQETNEVQLPAEPSGVSSPASECSKKAGSPDNGTPGLHPPCDIFLILIVRVIDPNLPAYYVGLISAHMCGI